MLSIENTIRGLMKVHGLKLGTAHRSAFAAKVATLLADAEELRMAIEPLLEARNMMRRQMVLLDRQISKMARNDEVCKRPMTISGVGPIVSLLFKATIDDPNRFKDSKAVAAHLGIDATRVPIGRDRPFRPCQQMWRQAYEARALRSGELAPAEIDKMVDAQGVGRQTRETGWREEGVRSGCPEARRHHASHVGG
ncbi:MAG TPA: transposase [Rhizomicrobium sp.]|jgi:transposase